MIIHETQLVLVVAAKIVGIVEKTSTKTRLKSSLLDVSILFSPAHTALQCTIF